MTFIERARLALRFMAKRSVSINDFPALRELWAPPLAAGVSVTPWTALNYSAVWNAVTLIASQVASLPFMVYRRRGDDERERANTHPAYKLLHDAPNPMTSPIVFWETLTAHALTWGNGYAEVEFDRASRPIALWNLTPDRVEPVFENGTLGYRYQRPSGGQTVLPPSDVLHVPGLGFDGLKGYSVVTMARKAIGLGMAAEGFGASFFGNSAIPGLVLTHPNTLTEEAQDRLKRSWYEKHQGPDRAQGLSVLEEGMKVEKIGVPPDDAQFLETREFQVVEIARWFNLPPHKLKHKVGERPGGNLESSQIEFLTDTLRPWLIRIEQECNRKLLSPPFYSEHLVDAILRADIGTRTAAYRTFFDMGVLSAERIAALENFPKPEPVEPAPAQPPPVEDDGRARRAEHALLSDVIGRWVRREVAAAQKAAKRGPQNFQTWLDEFYAAEPEMLRLLLEPAVRLRLALLGSDADAAETARLLAEEYMTVSRAQLEGVSVRDLPGNVKRVTERWEATRAVELADQVMGLKVEDKDAA